MQLPPNDHSLSLHPSRQRLLTKDGQALPFPTDGSTFVLGSHPDCQVAWQGDSIQPQHAEGRWSEGKLWVRDLHTGRTLVDGRKIGADQWTPMRDGGHLQLGSIQDPALSLAVLGPSPTSESSTRPIQLTFFGDGTSADIARHVRGQPARFERMIEKTGAPVKVNGVLAQGSSLAAMAKVAAPWALGALAVAGVAAAAAGAPLVLGGLLAAGGGLMSALTWQGSRQQWAELQGRPAVVPEGWKHVQHRVIQQGPRANQLEQLWQDSLGKWPGARHILYLSGHGFQQEAAGIRFDQLAQRIQGAEAVVIDACNGGQIEALARLGGSARIAVVSEHTVRGFGFPLEAMFGQKAFPEDSRELGVSLVQAAARGRPAASLVAVDLHTLQQRLLPSLDRLGRSLNRISQSGQKDTLLQCLAEAETSDADPPGSKVDLGSFLARLQERGLAGRCPELARCQQALNDTVLAMLGHGTLSFDRAAPAQQPEGWRAFLRSHRA